MRVVTEVTRRGWNSKSFCLLAAFAEGLPEAVWLDSDIALAGPVDLVFQRIPTGTVVAAEEAPWFNAQGTRLRTEGWGFEVGRALPVSINSCAMRFDASHRGLLERWNELLESDTYIAAQKMNWDVRPVHMKSDQDVLNALLGSTAFAATPLVLLKNGTEIAQCFEEDGYRVGNLVAIGGIDAAAKARRTGEAVLKRMDDILRQRNWGAFTETSIEVLGDEDSYGPHKHHVGGREAVLKLAAKHARREPLEIMMRELTSSGTSFAPGTSGYAGLRPKVTPVVRHFSCLVPKKEVPVTVHVAGDSFPATIDTAGGFDPKMLVRPHVDAKVEPATATVPLIKIAFARSGDKGNNSNIGVMARKAAYAPYIRAALTEAAVAKWFAHLFEGGKGRVERWDLPGTHALNFLLHDALGGGGVASLRNDPQGKALAQMLLEFPIPLPRELAADVQAEPFGFPTTM